jgi:hypothetical protein
MKGAKEKTEWDKKKIVLFVAGIILLLGIGLVFNRMMVAGSQTQNPPQTTSVKGDSTEIPNPASEIGKNIQTQVDNLKNEAQNINIVDVATSSPQVQKVINDLKAIQDYPKNQLRQTCEKICSGL